MAQSGWSQSYIILTSCNNGQTYIIPYDSSLTVDKWYWLTFDEGIPNDCYKITLHNASGFGKPPQDPAYDSLDPYSTKEGPSDSCELCNKKYKYTLLEDCQNNKYFTSYDFGTIFTDSVSSLNPETVLISYSDTSQNVPVIKNLCLTKFYISYGPIDISNDPNVTTLYTDITGILNQYGTVIEPGNCNCVLDYCKITMTLRLNSMECDLTLTEPYYLFSRPVYSVSYNGVPISLLYYTFEGNWLNVDLNGNNLAINSSDSFNPPSSGWISVSDEFLGIISIQNSSCCFKLTSCIDPNFVLYTNEDYSQETVIKINEFPDDCFIVSEETINCNLSVSTTLLESLSVCCDEKKGYKLSDCSNPSIFMYTDTDLSDYIDMVITIQDYDGGCLLVSSLDIAPPSAQTVTVLTSYPNCKECNSKRYELVNCSDPLDIIITITDLSSLVGKIIKIKGCPDSCYTVQDSINTTSTIEVIIQSRNDIYNTCLECNLPVQETIVKPTGRFIEPNYNVNYCSKDDYESKSCSFADNVYKEMLSVKYGIKHCCSEDFLKSYRKYQLMMYKIKEVPGITCLDINDCDCNCK